MGAFMSDNIEKDKYTKKVTLAGHNLTLTSDTSSEYLDELVLFIENKIKNISKINGVGISSVGIILSIEVCDELFSTKKKHNLKIEELNKQNSEEIENLKKKLYEESNDLKKTFDEQIEKIKISRSNSYDVVKKENQNLKDELEKIKNSNSGILELAQKQFNEDLNDFKIVYEEEIQDYIEQISKLNAEIEIIEKNYKQENFNKEKDIVKIVEDNSKLSEENVILRKRIEELMSLNAIDEEERFYNETSEEIEDEVNESIDIDIDFDEQMNDDENFIEIQNIAENTSTNNLNNIENNKNKNRFYKRNKNRGTNR